MRLRRNISGLRRIVRPQREMLRVFAAWLIDHGVVDQPPWDHIDQQIGSVETLLDSLKDTADIITEANEAFLSHSLNDTLRTLTIVSVVLIPPTLIAGIFGMNVTVPWQESPFGFWFVMALGMGVAFSVILFFKWKRWL